jgi:hypothetical protein
MGGARPWHGVQFFVQGFVQVIVLENACVIGGILV